MLGKKLKVSKQVFQEAFKKSRIISSDHLMMRFYKENEDLLSKFSFSVPKSVAKSAVTRNLLKRRGYATIKGLLKNIKKSYICLFSFKKGSSTLTFSQIKEEINLLLQKSKIIDF